MTTRFHCDGPDCTVHLGKDDARIAVTPVAARAPLAPIEPDPDTGEWPELPVVEFDFTIDGALHFCSPACLAAYGYAEHLKNLPAG